VGGEKEGKGASERAAGSFASLLPLSVGKGRKKKKRKMQDIFSIFPPRARSSAVERKGRGKKKNKKDARRGKIEFNCDTQASL